MKRDEEMNQARNSTFALYKNKEYKAHQDFHSNKIKLVSTDPKDLQLGFEERSPGKYFKEVYPQDVQSAYTVRSFALYQGTQFQVINITGDDILLYHSGPSPRAEQLGFRMVDRLEYEKVVERSELEKIWEERKPIKGFQLPNQTETNQ